MEMARWKQHCIYRVPEFIKKMTNRDAYQPQFVSLGPFTTESPISCPWRSTSAELFCIWLTGPGSLYRSSSRPSMKWQMTWKLPSAYNNDLDDKWRGANKDSFVEMMVTDGCFLLELIRIDEIQTNR